MSTRRELARDYKRLLKYLKPYRGAFIIATLCMAVVSSTSGAAAYLIQPLLDDIFIKKDRQTLMLLPWAIVAIYFVRGVGRYVSGSIMQRIGQQTVRDIRNHLYRHIQSLSLSFFHRHTTGKLVSRILNDINQIQDAISIVVYEMFREGLTVVALLGVLLYRDAKLALFVLVLLPFAGVLIGRLGSKLRWTFRHTQERMADISSIMHEAFSNVRVVKAFGMEEYEIGRFKDENERFYRLMVSAIRIFEISSPLLEFIGAFGIGAIIFFGGMQVIEGTTTVGSFFSFLTALFMIFGPITRVSRIYNKIMQAMASAARVFEILDQRPDVVESPGAAPLKPLAREVVFENVNFSYSHEPVLRDVNLSVKAGAVLAIVGTSGAGKSTLVDLIPRFYDPTAGRILFDGRDIKSASIVSLRAQTAIVTQEVFLFNDTVRNNIAYGRADMPLEKVIEAAKAAYAHDFILQMPNGYDTMIGERGTRLSGGQRQRISIARALVKNPAILILDEATSALDTKSEQEVQKALNNLMANRTTFVIAHRLSTILHADQIIVLEKGVIAERGTHAELIAKGGIYKNIHGLQFSTAPKAHGAD